MSWPRQSPTIIALTLLLGAPPLRAQSCDLFVAALTSAGADSEKTILVDETVLGVPSFAFNAYSTIRRGDTALIRMHMPSLDSLNRQRRPIATCLTSEHHWRTVADTALFPLFRGANGWPAFHKRFGDRTLFALISQPLIVGDTAMLVVAVAAGPLSGRGVLLQFVRGADGRWVKRSEAQLWIS